MLEGPTSDGVQRRPDTVSGRRALWLHIVVAAAYIAIGIFFEILLFSWLTGAFFMLAGVWLVPAIASRWAQGGAPPAEPPEDQL